MPAPSPIELRCPHCGLAWSASFEELRATGGWERCSRCSEMFDGFAQARSSGAEPERAAQGASAAAAMRRPAPKRVPAPGEGVHPTAADPRAAAHLHLPPETPPAKGHIKTRVYSVGAVPRRASQDAVGASPQAREPMAELEHGAVLAAPLPQAVFEPQPAFQDGGAPAPAPVAQVQEAQEAFAPEPEPEASRRSHDTTPSPIALPMAEKEWQAPSAPAPLAAPASEMARASSGLGSQRIAPGKAKEAAAIAAPAPEVEIEAAQPGSVEITLSTQAMELWLGEASKAKAEAAAKESASKRMESIASKGASPQAQARARVLSVPSPGKNKPAEPMTARSAAEALGMAKAARFNPFARARMPAMSARQWAIWGGSCALLAAALAFQVAWFGRGESAARSAGSMAAWSWACAKLGCSVELPQARSALALEGADVSLDAEGHLVFTAALKNTADYRSQAPKLWLAIEGPEGRILTAKVFEPKQWLGAQAIEPGASIDSKMAFDALDQPPEGFKAELVWPASK